jgi:hypothetical protein
VGGLFVNHRAGEHSIAVAALAQHLARHFGPEAVHFDAGPPTGTRYPGHLWKRLKAADVLVVVVHRDWTDDLDARRAALPAGRKDEVSFEVSSALRLDKPVVTVETVRLRCAELTADLDRLLRTLERHVPPSWEAPEPVPGPGAAVLAARVRRRVLTGAAAVFPVPLGLLLLPAAAGREQVTAWSAASVVPWLLAVTAAAVLLLCGVAVLRRPAHLVERSLTARRLAGETHRCATRRDFHVVAARLHTRLTSPSEWSGPRSRTQRDVALTTFHRLEELRDELELRRACGWWRWLVADHAVLTVVCATWTAGVAGLVAALLVAGGPPVLLLVEPAVALLAAAAVALGRAVQRSHSVRLVAELDGWLERLGPLVFPTAGRAGGRSSSC